MSARVNLAAREVVLESDNMPMPGRGCYDDEMATTEIATVKLVPHGKDLALLIDPQLLRELGIDEKTPLSVTTDGCAIFITPAVAIPHRSSSKHRLSA
jgi:hypothetical protein